MELRQLRYFVQVMESGSMGRAARELGVVTSALSQQISKLESELATRLLQRTSRGVIPTDAGLAFGRQAQLALRHIDEAAAAAQQARLTGQVSVGLASTTAGVLGLPLMQAMNERYPEVRLHLVEGMSGHIGAMLNARRLDLAVVFHGHTGRNWSIAPILDERLFLIADGRLAGLPDEDRIPLDRVGALPLVLPTDLHGLRATLDAAFERLRIQPLIVAEIDSLTMLMDAVQTGRMATIQPGAALARLDYSRLRHIEITTPGVERRNLLASLSDDELSPVALAARAVMAQTMRQLAADGLWMGASLHET